ncbi:MAG: hypothetical protein R2713_13250 [Ilumatobacteraceae bacterium]
MASSTIGLSAGEAKANDIAAANGTPRSVSRPAIGTVVHSHPGTSTPHAVAIGTATTVRRCNSRCHTRIGTRTATTADSNTPSTRNGNACSTIAVNSVLHSSIDSPTGDMLADR